MSFLKETERYIRHAIKRKSLRSAGITITTGGAFRITGGIGDLIVAARFVRDLLKATGGGTFSVFYTSPMAANLIFGELPGFSGAHHDSLYKYGRDYFRYALTLNQFIYVDKLPSFTNFISDDNSRALTEVLERYEKAVEPLSVVRDHHPFLDGATGRYAVLKGHSRRDFMHHLCRIPYGGDLVEIGQDKSAISRFGLTQARYVTIHNGYDENMQTSGGGRATKAYPFWAEVVSALKRGLDSDLEFVQIGVPKTSEHIPCADHDLIGKTSLSEAFGLLAGAAFHLDNEGGFVHAAAAMGKRSCVVFGPTSLDYFSYPNNLNFAPSQCGDCWWSEKTWMMKCPRGLAEPVCMQQNPSALAESVALWHRSSSTTLAD